MKKVNLCLIPVLILLLISTSNAFAEEDAKCDCSQASADENFEDIDWDLVHNRMKSLSTAGYHPFLMPLIMANSDFIELTDEQLEVFKKWRSKNRVKILHLMDKIIYERNQFHKLSLQKDTREEVLKAKQEKIFKLHQKVLKYQLSCRREILDNFTEQQWENFNFVLSSNGYVID
jgi:hypothetical protein